MRRSPSAWRRRCWSPGCPGASRHGCRPARVRAAGGRGLALVARRRALVAVLVVTGLCAVGHQALGFDVPAVAFLFAVYAAVRAGHRAVTVAAAVTMLVALPLAALALSPDLPVGRRSPGRGVRSK
ncbi:hypothetical protein ACFQZ4_06860 [Catellatospora coxensis]